MLTTPRRKKLDEVHLAICNLQSHTFVVFCLVFKHVSTNHQRMQSAGSGAVARQAADRTPASAVHAALTQKLSTTNPTFSLKFASSSFRTLL